MSEFNDIIDIDGDIIDIDGLEDCEESKIEKIVDYICDHWTLKECYEFIETHPGLSKKGDHSLCVYGGALDKLGIILKSRRDVVENEFVKNHYKDKNPSFLCSFFEKYDERGNAYDKVSWYMAAYRSIEFIKSHRPDRVCKKLLIYLFQNHIRVSDMKPKLCEVVPASIMAVATVDRGLNSVPLILWASGYIPVKFLGEGSFGEVWEVRDKISSKPNCAIKVVSDNKSFEEEKLSSEKLMQIFRGNPSALKYLMQSSILDDKLVGSELAEGDLTKHYKATGLKEGKTIRSLVSKIKQALKAVKSLHDAGYSHNDIKPANFLRIDTSKLISERKAFDKAGTDEKTHIKKHRIKLADFGTLTKIGDDKQQSPSYTLAFIPSTDEFKKLDAESVSKRDVFALGLTFMDLMLKRTSIGNKEPGINNDVVKYLQSKGAEKTCLKYGIADVYSGTPKEEIVNLLGIIYDMTKNTYKECISVDKALERVKRLKST